MADQEVDDRLHQLIIDRIDDWIVHRDTTVIAVFLVLTVVMSGGLAMSATDSGTDQFTQDVPAQIAFEEVTENFEQDAFGPGTATSTLIQEDRNVLSKKALESMLRAQHRLASDSSQSVVRTQSVATLVALELDPDAASTAAQLDALERATTTEVRAAVRTTLATNEGAAGLLSEDLNPTDPSASATIGTVTHSLEGVSASNAGTQGDSPFGPIQEEGTFIVESVDSDITLFGSGVISNELGSVIGESLILVVPAAVALIFIFLTIAYRDPIDMLIGLSSLAMAIIWTFGFMGYAGIAFTQILIAVPPLLLAVGIDFGIHAVNRYREERATDQAVTPSMRAATDQLLPAFTIVTGTTVLGFMANAVSELAPIREFGYTAAVGIIFTLLIFGIFLPALKHRVDRGRIAHGIGFISERPISSAESRLAQVLTGGVAIARRAPYLFMIVVVVTSGGLAYYGTGVGTEFTTENFLPPEETPAYLTVLPAPLAPSEYTVSRTIAFLEDTFESSSDDSVTVYIEGPLRDDRALEALNRATQDPPDSFVADGRDAAPQSILSVIDQQADRSDEFAALVAANDVDGNGVPDQNLERVYEALLASEAGASARSYITEDYSKTRLVFSVKADRSQSEVVADTRAVAADIRLAATATGGIVVFKAVSDVIGQAAYQSLALAILAAVVFLFVAYWALERRPGLGIVNIVPILVTIALLAASMRYLGVQFNAITGTVLSIGIGLGIDYSAHLVHRISEEYRQAADLFDALTVSVVGTGGALTGSMITTTSGTGVLVVALVPVLGQFGLLIALSVLYSYLTTLLILPSAVVMWDNGWGVFDPRRLMSGSNTSGE